MSYHQLTIPKIKDELRTLGVSGYSNKNKDELVAMLERAKPYSGISVRPVSPPRVLSVRPVSPRVVSPKVAPLSTRPVSPPRFVRPISPIITLPTVRPLSSPSLLDETKLVVFDFDLTVTGYHTCGEEPLSPEDILEMNMQSLLADLDIFRNTVEYLLQHGKNVAIASYGRQDVILALMGRIFENSPYGNPFNDDNVITPKAVSKKYGITWPECKGSPERSNKYNRDDYNKNNMLDILSEKYQLPMDEILLIDDTKENVDRAKSVGYNAINIPQQTTKGAVQKFRQELIRIGIPAHILR